MSFISELETTTNIVSQMTFVNNSVYELQSNVTIRSASKSEWVDLQSSVSCLGGWFQLPSGKVVCHITETKLHDERKKFCRQLGK